MFFIINKFYDNFDTINIEITIQSKSLTGEVFVILKPGVAGNSKSITLKNEHKNIS